MKRLFKYVFQWALVLLVFLLLGIEKVNAACATYYTSGYSTFCVLNQSGWECEPSTYCTPCNPGCITYEGSSYELVCPYIGDCTAKIILCDPPECVPSNDYQYQHCPPGQSTTCGSTAEAVSQNKALCTYSRTCNESLWVSSYGLPLCGASNILGTCYWNCSCCPTGDARVCTQGAEYNDLVYIDKTLSGAEKRIRREMCPHNAHDDIFVRNLRLADSGGYEVWRLWCIPQTCRCSSAAVPTPTPWIRTIIQNQGGTPVPVSGISRAFCTTTIPCTNSLALSINTADYTFAKTSNLPGIDQGGRITLTSSSGSPLVVLGTTPSIAGTYYPTCNGQSNAACYAWGSTTWTTGGRTVTFIVATPTPAPIPTPSVGGAWLQVVGGDVYAKENMYSYVPESPPGPSPRAFVLPGTGGYPGIVTYGTNYDFDVSESSKGQGWVSALNATTYANWLAKDSYSPVNFYQLMLRRFGGEPALWDDATAAFTALPAYQYEQNNGQDDKTKPIPYYIGSSLEVSNDLTIADGEKLVVFVGGNLTIKGQILTNGSGFVAFIVDGDIIVDPSVGTTYDLNTPVVNGVYISAGTFHTGTSTTLNHERFVASGVFVAGNFALERDLGLAVNPLASAELFMYDPQILITMPDAMRDSPIVWQEVAP